MVVASARPSPSSGGGGDELGGDSGASGFLDGQLPGGLGLFGGKANQGPDLALVLGCALVTNCHQMRKHLGSRDQPKVCSVPADGHAGQHLLAGEVGGLFGFKEVPHFP